MVRVIVLVIGIACLLSGHAKADTSFFPIDSFGVAGPIPTPGNIADLEGNTVGGAVSVRFDPGDLGFLMFDTDLSGTVAGTAPARLLFEIVSALPSPGGASGAGSSYISLLLGNIAQNGAGNLFFDRAPVDGLTAPNGAGSIFQYTEVNNTGIFSVTLDPFFSGCQSIGGCNAIVFGTSGTSAVGGPFSSGGSLTFASVVAASPEPSVWMLMIFGFVAIALQAKRQRYTLPKAQQSECKQKQKIQFNGGVRLRSIFAEPRAQSRFFGGRVFG